MLTVIMAIISRANLLSTQVEMQLITICNLLWVHTDGYELYSHR